MTVSPYFALVICKYKINASFNHYWCHVAGRLSCWNLVILSHYQYNLSQEYVPSPKQTCIKKYKIISSILPIKRMRRFRNYSKKYIQKQLSIITISSLIALPYLYLCVEEQEVLVILVILDTAQIWNLAFSVHRRISDIRSFSEPSGAIICLGIGSG